MNNRPEIDPKKWRRLGTVMDCILIFIAILIGQQIGNRYFAGKMLPVLLLTAGAALIMSFLKSILMELVYKSEALRRHFLKDEYRK